jgi:hypothetical protein
MTHKLKLSNLAALLLTNSLSTDSPSWKRDLRDTAVACHLLIAKLGQVEAPDKQDPKRKEWDATVVEYELTEREHATIKHCLEKLGAALPTGKPSFELINAFGLFPKE